MIKLSDDRIVELLGVYKVIVKTELISLIRLYIPLLLKWNERVSLTTVTDPEEIIKFHFGESLIAESLLPKKESRLADVGSGAGFPGVPLAMAVPGIDVTLIESNSKKCVFLAEVLRELQLSNARVFKGRMENLPQSSEPFDCITARALGSHGDLLNWSTDRLHPSGRVILWLGDADSRSIARIAGWSWSDRILIPGSRQRYLLVGSAES